MSVEDDIIANIAKQMQVEIDQEILDSLILEDAIKMGWTKTMIGYSYEISKWLSENTTGEYKCIHGRLWFEDGQDAVLFLLRWS
jgi:hypothetical protein